MQLAVAGAHLCLLEEGTHVYSTILFREKKVVKPGTMEMEMEMETDLEMEMKWKCKLNRSAVVTQGIDSRVSMLKVLAPSKLQSPLNFATVLYKARQTRFIVSHHDQRPLPLRPAALTLNKSSEQ